MVVYEVSGVVAIGSFAPGGILPVSGVTPQLVTVTNPGSVTVPTPLQISGIVSLSPNPFPVVPTGGTIPSGIVPVNIVGGNSGGGSGGNVSITSSITLPVSGVSPQLVTQTNNPTQIGISGIVQIGNYGTGNIAYIDANSTLRVGLANAATGNLASYTGTALNVNISGVASVNIGSTISVSGVTPQLVVPIGGAIASGIVPVNIVGGNTTVTISQPLQVSGVVSLSAGTFSNISGVVNIATGSVFSVSGITPQLVVPIGGTISSGIVPVNVVGGNFNIASTVAVSGVYPVVYPTSGVVTQLVNVVNATPISLPLAVSGVVPQLVVPTVIGSGIQPVNLVSSITQNNTIIGTVAVSGIVPQLVNIQNSGFVNASGVVSISSGTLAQLPASLGAKAVGSSLSVVPATAALFQVSGAISINSGSSVGITPLPLPAQISGVISTSYTSASGLNLPVLPNTNFLTSSISPVQPPSLLRTYIGFNASGILAINRKVGTISINEQLNAGSYLVSGAVYLFDSEMFAGDTINYQYSGSGVANIVRALEIPIQT